MATVTPVKDSALDEILAALPESSTPADKVLVERAFKFASQEHVGQVRASGQPYLNHCVAVALLLADLNLPPVAVAAGLLHDVVEDTHITIENIEAEFGEAIARMVDGVTKLTQRVERMDRARPDTAENGFGMTDRQAETIRKTLLAMEDDVRVVLIKLADRLHNMRTLRHLPAQKQRRIAQETLDIFAPLANRLGIWQIKWELEDLGLRYTQPTRYKEIVGEINARRAQRERIVQQIVERLQAALDEHGLNATVSGRAKHIYSIYKKMERKQVPFGKVFDVRAVRIIIGHRDSENATETKDPAPLEKQAIADCYLALGLVHQLWNPIPGEFDDYIATPKDNFYQSLHTAVVYDDGNTLEVQIRTEEMNQNAEYGIAAHWRYKEGDRGRDKAFEDRIAWLRSMMDWHQELTDGQDFVAALKSDLFPDRVFTFTPRGDIIDLPGGATPIDFAYHIHTSVGERCRGAKVNGKLVALNTRLKSGDQVEILTAKRGGPSRDWLNPDLGYIASARAREKIRSWFRKQARENNVAAGRGVVDRELRRINITNLSLDAIAKLFGYKKTDDFLAAVGCGDIHGQSVVMRIVRHLREESTEHADSLPPSESGKSAAPAVESGEVSIQGTGGLLTHTARCCNPAPGDEIIGYTTRGRGVTIHRRDCPNILRTREKERLIEVNWGRDETKKYPVPIRVVAYDREGLMRDIGTIIADEHVNMSAVNMPPLEGHQATLNLTLEVSNLSQLGKVLSRIEQLPNVTEVRRYKAG